MESVRRAVRPSARRAVRRAHASSSASNPSSSYTVYAHVGVGVGVRGCVRCEAVRSSTLYAPFGGIRRYGNSSTGVSYDLLNIEKRHDRSNSIRFDSIRFDSIQFDRTIGWVDRAGSRGAASNRIRTVGDIHTDRQTTYGVVRHILQLLTGSIIAAKRASRVLRQRRA